MLHAIKRGKEDKFVPLPKMPQTCIYTMCTKEDTYSLFFFFFPFILLPFPCLVCYHVLLNIPIIIHLSNIIINVMAAILSCLRLARHRSIHGVRIVIRLLCHIQLLTRCRGCRRCSRLGKVRQPGELDFADGGDGPGTEHEFLGLVAFFECHNQGVGLVGVWLNGFVFAKALVGSISQ